MSQKWRKQTTFRNQKKTTIFEFWTEVPFTPTFQWSFVVDCLMHLNKDHNAVYQEKNGIKFLEHKTGFQRRNRWPESTSPHELQKSTRRRVGESVLFWILIPQPKLPSLQLSPTHTCIIFTLCIKRAAASKLPRNALDSAKLDAVLQLPNHRHYCSWSAVSTANQQFRIKRTLCQ